MWIAPSLTPCLACTYDDSNGPTSYQRIPGTPRFPASLSTPWDTRKTEGGSPGDPRNMGNPGSRGKSGFLKTEARVCGFARVPARLRGLPIASRTPPSPSHRYPSPPPPSPSHRLPGPRDPRLRPPEMPEIPGKTPRMRGFRPLWTPWRRVFWVVRRGWGHETAGD